MQLWHVFVSTFKYSGFIRIRHHNIIRRILKGDIRLIIGALERRKLKVKRHVLKRAVEGLLIDALEKHRLRGLFLVQRRTWSVASTITGGHLETLFYVEMSLIQYRPCSI